MATEIDEDLIIKYNRFIYKKAKKKFANSFFMLPKKFKTTRHIKFTIITEIFRNSNNSILTLKKIQKKYEEKDNKFIPLETLRRYLKNFLGAKYTKIKIRNKKFEQNNYKIMMNFFIYKLYKLIKNNYALICLDESCFNNNKLPRKGWNIPKINDVALEPGRIKSLSLTLIIDELRVVMTDINEKTNNRHTYKDILISLNEKIENDFDLKQKKKDNKIVLIADNVPFHKTKENIEYLKTIGINVMYTPPYQPDMNPVESAFSFLKSKFRQNIFEDR